MPEDEVCVDCQDDASMRWRETLGAAVEIALQIEAPGDEDAREQFYRLQKQAMSVLGKAFDAELFPKGLGR